MLTNESFRIGYVVKRYPRYSETFIVNEVLAHEAAGWDISIFALRPPADTHFQDCISRVRAPIHYLAGEKVKGETFSRNLHEAVERLPRLLPLLPSLGRYACQEVSQAIELALLVKQQDIQHLHAHFATSPTTIAQLAAGLAGIRFTFTAHAKDIFHEEVGREDLARKLSAANAVVTVSDFNLEYLRERFGENATGVHRIYNGLDLDRFQFDPAPPVAPTIISVGRLVEKKGFADLIRACQILRQRDQPFSCRIIGTGELDQELRKQVRDLGLDDQVHFDGALPQRDVIKSIKESSVFVAPCVVGRDGNRDGLPTVLLESMALGTPCVSTDVTGIPEVIQHVETGLVVPQHNPTELASSMARLLADAKLRRRLAMKARALIEQDFDILTNTSSMRSLIESCNARPQFAEAG